MLTAGVNAAKLLKYTYFRLMRLKERSVRYTLHLFRDICGDRDMFHGIKIEKSSRSGKLHPYFMAMTQP